MANLMFELPAVELATKARDGTGLVLGEVVATLGLLLTIFGVVRSGRPGAAPFAVGAYIAAAYYFTSSTSFANPAVTMARMFSDTFTGIQPFSAPPFVAAQLAGCVLAVLLVRVLYPRLAADVPDLLVPHEDGSPEPDSTALLDELAPPN